MRVLLDENIDRLLKPLFAPEFEVLTVRERGWNGIRNGELLRLAAQEFDAFVTMDGNLEFQQNVRALKLGVLVLRAASNAFPVVSPLIPKANAVLRTIRPGQVVHVPA